MGSIISLDGLTFLAESRDSDPWKGPLKSTMTLSVVEGEPANQQTSKPTCIRQIFKTLGRVLGIVDVGVVGE